jgi:hypothetical protein
LLAPVALWLAAPTLIASRIRAIAAERTLDASWRSLQVRPPLTILVTRLVFVRSNGDTAARIESLDVGVDPWSVLTLSPRPTQLALKGARFAVGGPGPGGTTAPVMVRLGGRLHADRLPHIRAAARRAARFLMQDPERLSVSLRDVTVLSADPDDGPRAALGLDSLELAPSAGGVHLTARGVAGLEDDTPFTADLVYRHDGRLTGGADFALGSPGKPQHLGVTFDARVDRGGSPPALRLEEGSTIGLGPIPLHVSGFIEPTAPRVRFALTSRGLSPDTLVRRMPAALLGPLAQLRVSGTFDYALDFDLDLERPDSVSFRADVTSHGLALDPVATRLDLAGLAAPFTAEIHLPKGRIVSRELSSGNPHFRTLDQIDSTLAHAVVTNEDGGFYRHRGFNAEAVKDAIAENLHAGAYRRGAGTITMQLVRNLYLGHDRTLSRKAQEVVLAWILEHLTGVSKQRLLEIYLNIIEWGPEVHGADEACQYYFGHDAGRVTPDEALFLATVVPAPTRWKNRFDKDGLLRPFERAQMHFIGRAMVAKGWLDASMLLPADSMRVGLRGPARDALFPPPPAAPDSAGRRPGATNDDGENPPN